MSDLDLLRRLWDHAAWADLALLAALEGAATPPDEAVREYAHVLGAEETWLARLEGRPSRTVVWPALDRAEAAAFGRQLRAGYAAYLGALDDEALATATYTNSAGQQFSNLVGDILLQVMLHGQYHRGRINLMLRQGGFAPAPVDYIAFVRGVPAPPGGPARGAPQLST